MTRGWEEMNGLSEMTIDEYQDAFGSSFHVSNPRYFHWRDVDGESAPACRACGGTPRLRGWSDSDEIALYQCDCGKRYYFLTCLVPDADEDSYTGEIDCSWGKLRVPWALRQAASKRHI